MTLFPKCCLLVCLESIGRYVTHYDGGFNSTFCKLADWADRCIVWRDSAYLKHAVISSCIISSCILVDYHPLVLFPPPPLRTKKKIFY